MESRGKRPNHLAYETLTHLMRRGSLHGLGPKARAALILLFLALEAIREMGPDGKPPKVPDLARAARALDDGRSRFGQALREALEKNLELFLPWAPKEVQAQPPPKRAGALRRHLVRSAAGYRSRDLWREVLRAVAKGWRLSSGAPSCQSGGCVCLPPRPEVLLALIPLPAMGEAFFATIAEHNRLKSRSLLEGATGAHFAFGFLGYGEAFPFVRDICGMFQPVANLRSMCEDGRAILFADGRGDLLEAARGQHPGQVRLRAYLNADGDVRLPSPSLQSLLEPWYALAYPLLDAYLAKGGPLYASSDSGYDWDLVEEYHEAILRGWREGRCPFPSAHGTGVAT
ncbi:hypothetical protein [Thermus brockianus]|uniref:Uncharacterized protein n=1 Tax=Thermus brockianus TaxID=56956 RepID=A0ABN6NKV0_THEBO|nr:hypothetical protein [Thermus brockianus]BDG17692.1 hypothetical protein TbrSNM41_24260 [Thermus brockianus]